MSGVLRSLRAELYRLVRSRPALASGLLLVALPALRVLASRAADAAALAERVLAGRDATALSLDRPGGAWAPFVEGWRAGLVLAALLLLIHAARSLAGDLESGVLRLASTRSVARPALVGGRALLGLLLVPAMVAVTGLSALGCAAWLYEFGPLVEEGYEILSAAELQRELALSVAAVLAPLVAIHAFGLFVSAFARSAVGAVGTALALFLVFDLFKEALGRSQYLVFAAFTPALVDRSALGEMVGVARGFSDAGFSEELLRTSLLLPWPEAALLVAGACVLVSRRAL